MFKGTTDLRAAPHSTELAAYLLVQPVQSYSGRDQCRDSSIGLGLPAKLWPPALWSGLLTRTPPCNSARCPGQGDPLASDCSIPRGGKATGRRWSACERFFPEAAGHGLTPWRFLSSPSCAGWWHLTASLSPSLASSVKTRPTLNEPSSGLSWRLLTGEATLLAGMELLSPGGAAPDLLSYPSTVQGVPRGIACQGPSESHVSTPALNPQGQESRANGKTLTAASVTGPCSHRCCSGALSCCHRRKGLGPRVGHPPLAEACGLQGDWGV